MLAAENLGKRFGSRWLFRGISFRVEPQQCLVIAGHNGSGKSTLVKALAGLIPASEGKAKIEGDPRKTLGYMALELHPYANLTPLEHLQLFARMRGLSPAGSEELLDFVGLLSLLKGNVTAGQMSSGMKARLKLALAIQAEPAVLILDEPGSALDQNGLEILRKVRDAQLKRGSIIVATNDADERRWATHELRLGE